MSVSRNTALNALTRTFAGELRKQLKVNAVCPGWVATDMRGQAGVHWKAAREALSGVQPCPTTGRPAASSGRPTATVVILVGIAQRARAVAACYAGSGKFGWQLAASGPAVAKSYWCGWSGSNRHALRNRILNPARLPIPPHPHRAAWLLCDS